MQRELFINVRPYQTRIASTEKKILKELFYYRDKTPSLVGTLYKGCVTKITKHLNFAFVDLGLKRSGFLYGKDLLGKEKEISKTLKVGQNILVQIKTDPLRNKGVRLSMDIGMAGLYLVYLPNQKKKITISRQITELKERERLSEIVKSFHEKGTIILRTFAKGQEKKVFQKDLEHLKSEWKKIQEAFLIQQGPGCLYKGEEPLFVFLRDHFGRDIEKIFIDEKETFKKVTKWTKTFRPDLAKKIEHYKKTLPLFKNFNLESQVQKAEQKKVHLKNGGFLIFEELEAFCVIDVNSGRFSGTKNLSNSLLNLNLEAAKIITEQVQIRNLSGIILVDFIDMQDISNRKKVVSCLEKGFKGDKSNPKVFPMVELGMVQITRKRSTNSMSHFMTEICTNCNGLGRKKTLDSITNDLFLTVEKFSPTGLRFFRKTQSLKIFCHPKLKKNIEEREKESLDFFKKTLSLDLLFEEDPKILIQNFQIEKF